ncbi:MAG: sialate O-acetylesterase [Fulvivirga sp.]
MKKLILIFLFCCAINAYSQTKLPSFFSNNMVLQQNEAVSIWGTDTPETKISIKASWGEKVQTESDAAGKWKVKIETPEAGGPYSLSIKGSEEVLLQDILIGEVWLCSGQSNMEMVLKGYRNQPIIGSNEAILNSGNNLIRVFKAERNASVEPLNDVEGDWTVSGPATSGDFSATAYFFAKKMQKVLDVPVGIITTSWGGSNVETWIDQKTLRNFEDLIIPTSVPEKAPNKVPTLLYNGMLHPFLGFNIKGVLWYQGEANRVNYSEYKDLFSAMIESWRANWSQGDFPFYFVQIAPYGYNGVNSAFVREAQLQTMQTVANTGMAVTMDIGACNSIHPPEKKLVGDRLAYWALAKTYGIEGIAFSGPVYKSYDVDKGKVNVAFEYSEIGLYTFDSELTGFTIAGEDRDFHPAKAKINRDGTVTVWSDEVKEPVAVRYGFESCIKGTLYNVAGLPASSFRTDNWEEEKVVN